MCKRMPDDTQAFGQTQFFVGVDVQMTSAIAGFHNHRQLTDAYNRQNSHDRALLTGSEIAVEGVIQTMATTKHTKRAW